MPNGRMESLNCRLRGECLNVRWFTTLAEARCEVEACREECNSECPHSSLDYRRPDEFARLAAETPAGRPFVVEILATAARSGRRDTPAGSSVRPRLPSAPDQTQTIRRRRGRIKCSLDLVAVYPIKLDRRKKTP